MGIAKQPTPNSLSLCLYCILKLYLGAHFALRATAPLSLSAISAILYFISRKRKVNHVKLSLKIKISGMLKNESPQRSLVRKPERGQPTTQTPPVPCPTP